MTPARRPLLILAALAALAGTACGQQGSDTMNAQHFGSPQAAALYSAAARGELERARQLMAQGVSLNSANAREQTLLDVAMLQGNRRAFDNLLTLGADPTYLGEFRDTSMHLASILENPYWLKAMLARGASTETRNVLGETPLFRALGQNTRANAQLLLDAGADIHARTKARETLLHAAASINSFADVVRFLELGVDPRATDDLGYTFQYSFFDTPENILSDEARSVRTKVRAWLRARQIPVEEPIASAP